MTRFWLSSDSVSVPGVSPAPAAEWDRTTGIQRRHLNIIKGASARFDTGTMITKPAALTTSNNDVLQGQHISPPLAAVNISGTFKCYIQGRQAVAAANWRSQIIVRALDEAGTTVLATLYAGDLATLTADPTGEFNVSTSVEMNRSFPRGGSGAISSASLADGWRLVVETGIRSHEAGNTNRFGALVYGEPAGGDLPENETDTSTNLAPWFELSATVALYVPSNKRLKASMYMTG